MSLTALPTARFTGPVPPFPLANASDRELELWSQTWTLPQAHAWSLPSEAWRARAVAMWVRTSVRCEALDAPAALLAQVHRFADQVGLTTAGLAEMGWTIAVDELNERRIAEQDDDEPEQRRLSAV